MVEGSQTSSEASSSYCFPGTIEQALKALKNGEFLAVADDEDRENEVDLVIASEKMTKEKMAFLIKHTSGVVCVSVPGDRLDQLQLQLMISQTQNTESHGCKFTVSCDYNIGTTTGISAADRSATVKALIDPSAKPEDFRRPGHMFPLRYSEGGVLTRAGHTEASVDLARLANLYPSGVICELVDENCMEMVRSRDVESFCRKHQIVFVTIAQLIEYRRKNNV
eukprot:TRINITY_DN4947_c0_g1_i1.p1 TRINITY_DN4947_c0_g1~~TRINITY_DN4947_c0_g1_i1.p1  ORF type:complete len:223 (+),score=37.30 TRINITY_DN4947_c0_g1_i1:180-848(+)